MSWSEWQPLTQNLDHKGPAVYELRIVTAAGPIPVPRFLAIDERGLLLIGESGNLDDRRLRFIYAMKKCSGHSEGNLLYYLLLYSPLKNVHPEHDLEFRYRKQPDKRAAQLVEARLIKAYVREFGEVPPLNSAIPDRYGNWECEDAC